MSPTQEGPITKILTLDIFKLFIIYQLLIIYFEYNNISKIQIIFLKK